MSDVNNVEVEVTAENVAAAEQPVVETVAVEPVAEAAAEAVAEEAAPVEVAGE